MSKPVMRLVFIREAVPDAPYWAGRRLLALVGAVAWPAAWITLQYICHRRRASLDR
jgi:hypothetical protein